MFIGYLRAARGERLLGNKTFIESDPCKTRGEAESWVSTMLASNVETGKPVVESGVRKHEAKAKKGKRTAARVETDTDVERETAERQAKAAKSRRRARAGSSNRRADHAPAARANAEK